MVKHIQYTLSAHVSLADAEETLRLAMLAVEGLFGAARVRLDVHYHIVQELRSIHLDAANEPGQAVVRIFTGLLLREFGDDAFVCRDRDLPTVARPSEN